MSYEDEFGSVHEENADTIETAGLDHGGSGVLVSNDEFSSYDYENRGDIKIPDYMKSKGGKTVIEYREE